MRSLILGISIKWRLNLPNLLKRVKQQVRHNELVYNQQANFGRIAVIKLPIKSPVKLTTDLMRCIKMIKS